VIGGKSDHIDPVIAGSGVCLAQSPLSHQSATNSSISQTLFAIPAAIAGVITNVWLSSSTRPHTGDRSRTDRAISAELNARGMSSHQLTLAALNGRFGIALRDRE
jgi:hypothetical protein